MGTPLETPKITLEAPSELSEHPCTYLGGVFLKTRLGAPLGDPKKLEKRCLLEGAPHG